MIVDIFKKIWNFWKKILKNFFEKKIFFSTFLQGSNLAKEKKISTIVYYCNTVVIVYNSIVYYHLPSFTVVLESLLPANKSIFVMWICIFGSFKLFHSSKIDFWPFLKLQKMEFGQKLFSWNWFICFHEFFSLEFLKFSGLLVKATSKTQLLKARSATT